MNANLKYSHFIVRHKIAMDLSILYRASSSPINKKDLNLENQIISPPTTVIMDVDDIANQACIN